EKEFKSSTTTIAGGKPAINKYRTSSSAFIRLHQTPIVQCIERRFAQFQGDVDVQCIEPLQSVASAGLTAVQDSFYEKSLVVC
ncbi:unnamed protein product, partial [Adineta steineri]